MNKRIVMALLLCALPVAAWAQSSNARLSGTVSDQTGALIPGVDITATNTETGVVSTAFSNETGVYNFPSLLPGVYTVSAALPGFQTRTFTDVRLGNAAQVRLNFDLQVADVATAIEVTASAGQLLLESTSSVGNVLSQETVRAMPVVGPTGSDVLDLIRLAGGVSAPGQNTRPIFGANNTLLAGVSAANIGIQRDGVEAGAGGRWPAGIQSATIINPDLVGEFRVILAPVDAEIGRGNSQIQVQTRSGTNAFRGAAVWNVQNSALDPNTWSNNRVEGGPATRPWQNIHEYTVSLGGPIVRNRTHFFALWNGLLPTIRQDINATILTPCARNGIFRYFDNWSNGNVFQTTTGGATPTRAVVDASGNPMAPATNPNGTAHNGVLRYVSVFGQLQNTPVQPDCSDAIVTPGTSWDPYRTGVDPTGYVDQLLGVMPLPNNYEVGDGLNTAGHRWNLSRTGADNRFGFGESNNRKQINIKIDHNFDPNHKINGSYSYERNSAANTWGVWPFRFPGAAFRRPQVLTVNFTSTLSPNLLNEARFGMRRTGTNTPIGFTNPDTGADALAWFPSVSGVPVLPQLGIDPVCVCGGQPFGTRGGGANLFPGTVNESSPLYTYSDTMSWTRGTHAFKGGVEFRTAKSELSIDVDSNDFSTYLRAFGGETDRTPIAGVNTTNMPGLVGTATTGNNEALRGLMSLLSGSLSRVTQLYWLGSADRLDTWDDYRVSTQRTRELNQNEFSVFFKDDWKATRDLTINLGMRWDYYGVPWVSDGLTASPAGGGDALFGISGRGFDGWMQPGARAGETELIFVGPDSPNPDVLAWPRDLNNFGPAVGFAWQVPWFGAGQTTVRGGYQVSYLLGGGRFNTLESPLANPPGSSFNATFDGGPGDFEYLDLSDVQNIFPVPVPVSPMEPVPVTARNVNLTAFDSNYVTPYVQNLTLAITRNLGQNVTLDVKYVGTLSRKLYDTIPINDPNFLFNGLKEAFDSARAGGESDLLDQMFDGINIAGGAFGPVGTVRNGVLQTGAMHLRAAAAGNIRGNLANGNYVAVANTLNTLNWSTGSNPGLPAVPAGVNGAVLRQNGFPENFIKTNPQYNNATLQTNAGSANYHSMQAQVTLRPIYGFTYQGTYTWSKSLERTGGWTAPFDRRPDYVLNSTNRAHEFRSFGSFDLPVGPNQLLLGNSSGTLARIVEGWSMSWFFNMGTGTPTSIAAASMLYANGVPDVVGPFDPSIGGVSWEDGALSGNYFDNAYTKVPDPQCATVTSLQGLGARCTLNAIADSSGNIVLQHPLPGNRGTLGRNVIENPGIWAFDTAMSKTFTISENRRLQFRVDALNIFNHPDPANPSLTLAGGTPFGNIASKSGNRQFKAQIRLEF